MPTKKGIKARMNGLVNFSGNNPQKEKVQEPESNYNVGFFKPFNVAVYMASYQICN